MSPSYGALGPASAAIYAALNIPAITSLAPGGVHDVLPQNTAYPCVLFSVTDNKQFGGFGTQPGRGQLPELLVRIMVFSQQQNLSEAHAILEQCLAALATPPTVAGYGSWAIFHDQTLDLGDQVVANVTVHELDAVLRLYVEQLGP